MMNRSIRHLLDALLSHNGYHVLLAENGEKGFELFRRERPDVIVLDLKMPEMDGLTVLRHIRSLNLAQPVIIYSGAWTPRRSSRLGPLGLLRASQRTARWFIWDCAAWGLKLSSRKKKDVAEGEGLELHLCCMKESCVVRIVAVILAALSMTILSGCVGDWFVIRTIEEIKRSESRAEYASNKTPDKVTDWMMQRLYSYSNSRGELGRMRK